MKKISLVLLIGLSAGSLAACAETEEDAAVETEETAGVEDLQEEEAEGGNEQVAEGTEETATTEMAPEASEIELTHVHGLGVTGDGSALYVPSHDGLKVFEEGTWRSAEGEAHDYMGFAMVDDGFYTSGHPVRGSDLANPFGISRSTDMGQSLEMLDLYKEIDFHLMDVGYNSHAIYVVNPQPNSRMDQVGIYYSTDDAETWTYSAAEGLDGQQLMSIGVHPEEEAVVAVGTEQGVFVSENFGQSFETVSDVPTTAVTFSPEGKLLAGGVADAFTLTAFERETGETTAYTIPELSGENAIGYIAVNPQNEQQIYFATYEKDLFLSEDGGESWNQIADKGTGINLR